MRNQNLCGPSKEEAMVDIRKIITMREMVLAEPGVAARRPGLRQTLAIYYT